MKLNKNNFLIILLLSLSASAAPLVSQVSRDSAGNASWTLDFGDLKVYRSCQAFLGPVNGALNPIRDPHQQFYERVVRFLSVENGGEIKSDRAGRIIAFFDFEGDGLTIDRDESGRAIKINVGRSPAWPFFTISEPSRVSEIETILISKSTSP